MAKGGLVKTASANFKLATGGAGKSLSKKFGENEGNEGGSARAAGFGGYPSNAYDNYSYSPTSYTSRYNPFVIRTQYDPIGLTNWRI